MRISACRNSMITCLLAHFEIPSAVSFPAAHVRFSRKSCRVSTSVTVEEIRGAGDTLMGQILPVAPCAGHMIADWMGLTGWDCMRTAWDCISNRVPGIFTARRIRAALILSHAGDD